MRLAILISTTVVGLVIGCGKSESQIREERYRQAAKLLKIEEDILANMETRYWANKELMRASVDKDEVSKYANESIALAGEIAVQKEAVKKAKAECDAIAAGS